MAIELGQKSIIHSLTSRPSEAAARFERPRRRPRPRPGGGHRVLRGGAQAAVDPRRLKRRGDDMGKMDMNGISIREYQ